MNVPDHLHYSKDHEWASLTARGTLRIGITDYAQDALGDVVFVQVPAEGATVSAGESCSEVESTKSVSEIYAPVGGRVALVNTQLADQPELLNSDPYGEGWICEIEADDPTALDKMLDAAAYLAFIEG